MASIPILDDLNLNFAEIIKGRIENVLSLPTNLGLEAKGYMVYYKNKIWVWDGFSWMTWNNVNWYTSENLFDPSVSFQESTARNITSTVLLDTDLGHISIAEGFTDYIPRTLGTIHFIGNQYAIDDWSIINGKRLVYTARDGCWFNIKNKSQNSIPLVHKKIDTKTNNDLFEVVKAEFVFNIFEDMWILTSFERKRHIVWFKKFDILPTQRVDYSPIIGAIPSNTTEGLLYNGYYQIDIFIEVIEFTETIEQISTVLPQVLEICGPDNIWLTIDKSGNYVPAMGELSKWFNNSLQGSAIIYVDKNICTDRKINWRVTLPNGAFKQVLGGYMHVKYLGKQEGTVCIG